MNPVGLQQLREALAATGALLSREGFRGPIEVVLAGAAAGLFGGFLPLTRVTVDCDVIWISDEKAWETIVAASQRIGTLLSLPDKWLNKDAQHFLHLAPLGWLDRAEQAETFGPIRVKRLSRVDLMGMKIISATRRGRDLLDLRALKPTRAELQVIRDHIDRVETEDLDNQSFDDARRIAGDLEREADG